MSSRPGWAQSRFDHAALWRRVASLRGQEGWAGRRAGRGLNHRKTLLLSSVPGSWAQAGESGSHQCSEPSQRQLGGWRAWKITRAPFSPFLTPSVSLSLIHRGSAFLRASSRVHVDPGTVCVYTRTPIHARGGGGMGVPICSPQHLSPCSTWGSCWQCFLSLSFPSMSTCPCLTLTVSLETGEGGSGVARLEAGGCQSQGAGDQESWPGPAGSVLSRVPQEASVDPCLPDQDPGGQLGLGPPPPSCSPLPCSAPRLPLRTWADPLHLPSTKPSLSQGLRRAPYHFLREPVSDSCTYRSRHPSTVTSLTGHSLKPERKCKELVCLFTVLV